MKSPPATVVIMILPDDQIRVFPSEVVFTSLNWTQPQSILVEAVDDRYDEMSQEQMIRHIVRPDDSQYDGNHLVPFRPPDGASFMTSPTEEIGAGLNDYCYGYDMA